MRKNLPRLTATNWIEAALKILEEKDINQVKIAPLAKILGVTKGSFYWHFKDRQALLDAMLDHWHNEKTLDVINMIDAVSGIASERLLALLKAGVETLGTTRVEPAIRSWARSDKQVNRIVCQVDTERLNYVKDLLMEIGNNESTAINKARMVNFVRTGLFWTGDEMTKAEFNSFVEDLYQILIQH